MQLVYWHILFVHSLKISLDNYWSAMLLHSNDNIESYDIDTVQTDKSRWG